MPYCLAIRTFETSADAVPAAVAAVTTNSASAHISRLIILVLRQPELSRCPASVIAPAADFGVTSRKLLSVRPLAAQMHHQVARCIHHDLRPRPHDDGGFGLFDDGGPLD